MGLRLGSEILDTTVSTAASCLLHLHPLTPALRTDPGVSSCTAQALWVTGHGNPTSATGLPGAGVEGGKRSWARGLQGGGLFSLRPLSCSLLLCLSLDGLCSLGTFFRHPAATWPLEPKSGFFWLVTQNKGRDSPLVEVKR